MFINFSRRSNGYCCGCYYVWDAAAAGTITAASTHSMALITAASTHSMALITAASTHINAATQCDVTAAQFSAVCCSRWIWTRFESIILLSIPYRDG